MSRPHGRPGVFHLAHELAVRIEDLDALVLAIGHPEQPVRIDRDAVRDLELPGRRAFAAPRRDELPVLVELQDARIAPRPRRVPLHDEDVAVAADRRRRSADSACASRRLRSTRPLRLSCRASAAPGPSRFNFSTMCAPTSVAQRLPSRSMRRPCERVNSLSPNARRKVPFSSNSKNAWAPRVSTNRWPLASKATLAAAPIVVPAGSGSGSARRHSRGPARFAGPAAPGPTAVARTPGSTASTPER